MFTAYYTMNILYVYNPLHHSKTIAHKITLSGIFVVYLRYICEPSNCWLCCTLILPV